MSFAPAIARMSPGRSIQLWSAGEVVRQSSGQKLRYRPACARRGRGVRRDGAALGGLRRVVCSARRGFAGNGPQREGRAAAGRRPPGTAGVALRTREGGARCSGRRYCALCRYSASTQPRFNSRYQVRPSCCTGPSLIVPCVPSGIQVSTCDERPGSLRTFRQSPVPATTTVSPCAKLKPVGSAGVALAAGGVGGGVDGCAGAAGCGVGVGDEAGGVATTLDPSTAARKSATAQPRLLSFHQV